MKNFCSTMLAMLVSLGMTVAMVATASAADPLTGDHIPTDHGDMIIHPINHATLVIGWDGKTIYVDPVGGAARFEGLPQPDLILITHGHGDHFNVATLEAVASNTVVVVAPPSVAAKLPIPLSKNALILTNGATVGVGGVSVEAVPAYNLTPERLKNHPKGRDNGYVVTLGGKRIYLSGDTEDVPEMRALKSIDVAFVCMNLPYTMTVEQAADAVRAFKPKIVYPYHCRGSDLEKFKSLVGADSGIDVRVRDWYGK
jgi:L-ascorbate metabolism protein UlaG (beta-lactamase superfamily)